MELSIPDWHKRFSIQASWTQDLRDYLFGSAGLVGKTQVLELGSGTGALLSEIAGEKPTTGRPALFGLDINPGFLSFAHALSPEILLVQADAVRAPFCNQSFDIVFCHFLNFIT